jgi:putative membrane protein insertion efficiency factor
MGFAPVCMARFKRLLACCILRNGVPLEHPGNRVLGIPVQVGDHERPMILLPRRDTIVLMVKDYSARLAAAWATILQLPRLAGRGVITAYRYTLSPLIGWDCRHLPTCSEYSDDAIARFGLWAGGWMTLARLCRCHPWGTAGLDFVPAVAPAKAHWFLPWRSGRWHGTNDVPPIDS